MNLDNLESINLRDRTLIINREEISYNHDSKKFFHVLDGAWKNNWVIMMKDGRGRTTVSEAEPSFVRKLVIDLLNTLPPINIVFL